MKTLDSQKIMMKSNKGFVYSDNQKSFEDLLQVGEKIQTITKDKKRKITMVVTGVELVFDRKKMDVSPKATCTLVKIKEEKIEGEA